MLGFRMVPMASDVEESTVCAVAPTPTLPTPPKAVAGEGAGKKCGCSPQRPKPRWGREPEKIRYTRCVSRTLHLWTLAGGKLYKPLR